MSCSEAGGDKTRGLGVWCVGTQARCPQPAWARVPPGSVGCRNQQQLLPRAAGSRLRGVLRISPAVGGDAEGVSPRVGSRHGCSLLGASRGIGESPIHQNASGANNPLPGGDSGDPSLLLFLLWSTQGEFPPVPPSCREHPGAGVRPRAAGLERPGPQAQGQGGRRAALRSPNAHVRKWLHFSERKREVRLPRRGRHSSSRSLRAPFVLTAQSP